jgi:hypothetical protein
MCSGLSHVLMPLPVCVSGWVGLGCGVWGGGGSSSAAAEAEEYREDLYDRPPPEDKVRNQNRDQKCVVCL